jgi:hypothetical protein
MTPYHCSGEGPALPEQKTHRALSQQDTQKPDTTEAF